MELSNEELWKQGYNPLGFNFQPYELEKFQKRYSLDEMSALIEKAKVAFEQYKAENGTLELAKVAFDFETEQIVPRPKHRRVDRNDFSDLDGVKKPMTVAQLDRLFDKFHYTLGKELINRLSDDHQNYQEWVNQTPKQRMEFTREFFNEFGYEPEEFFDEYTKIMDIKHQNSLKKCGKVGEPNANQ